jgi:acyl-CoA synthetase (AMP-forming)/AMP-acid ligase II
VTYAALSRRVQELAARLSGDRRLVLVEGGSTPETVVAYLATLAAGHVVLLAASGARGPAAQLRATYDPDVVLGPSGSVEIVRAESAHDLNPELALLLSTSGSTGSAKLVRLSAENLAANADQIAGYLDIREDDCAALTVPLTYCYGLSVVHTHLARGASVLLTDLSVVDECFWRLFDTAGATTFAGVPHTFDMLERSGFADRDVPRLRYVTQAGGRMDPDRVRGWARLGRERGWTLFVMYGQCEATARMAYLPPDLALEHPDTVGVAVPGASIDIEDGEIVFRGPNVMLGYAHGPADLGLGRAVDSLRTGDLGRVTPAGLLQVVGRRARFVKVLGHRVDLDTLERRLRAQGHDVRCAGRDDRLVVAARGIGSVPAREAVRRAAIGASGVPRDAVRVVAVEEHPALGSGKPDYAAILQLDDVDTDAAGTGQGSVPQLYATVLNREDVPDDATFVSLEGDSLSYVEASVRLEALLGHLPSDWDVTPVRELELLRSRTDRRGVEPVAYAPGTRRRRPWRPATDVASRLAWRAMESAVWLRALAIVLIVGTHAGLISVQGSANALLVIAGHHLARFQLAEPDRRARVARIVRGAVRIAVPSLVVIVGAHAVGGYYETRNLFLVNWIFGEAELGPPWRFWFVEALLVALALTAALIALPAVHRLERRFPFGLPLAMTICALVLFRLPLLPIPVPRMHGSALVVLHLFLLGWTLARATTPRRLRLMSLLVVAMVGTFSFNPVRDGLTIAFVLLLMWRPVTRVPAALVPGIRVLAAASLYIYVIHWQALELLRGNPVAAFIGSLALGIAYWWCWRHLPALPWRRSAWRGSDGRTAFPVPLRAARRIGSRAEPRTPRGRRRLDTGLPTPVMPPSLR